MKKQSKKQVQKSHSAYKFFICSLMGLELDDVSEKEAKELGKMKVEDNKTTIKKGQPSDVEVAD